VVYGATCQGVMIPMTYPKFLKVLAVVKLIANAVVRLCEALEGLYLDI
jgi:hypothetical protein